MDKIKAKKYNSEVIKEKRVTSEITDYSLISTLTASLYVAPRSFHF